MKQRDDFDNKTIEALAKRASFICSNPDCRCLTLAASEVDEMKFIYNGIAAHITAASEGGPRYDAKMTSEQRADISNGIFLCGNCSIAIDKNNGIDFSSKKLLEWKKEHENWIKENLNKNITNSIVIVDGEHHAKGVGNVTGLEIKKSAIIQPGTIVTAEGIGNITGTKIE
ncbi:MAG: hypothetical protein ACRCSM_11420 [Sediminibacterium sp.]|jgi:hypothetical protein|nr:hypothetical protein [Chitinophagaceae bacterium]MCA6447215.1 hypothetical protein [Chitinophagaceae bacterium]